MNIIYEPSGRAREYSPLALNHYTGCDHKCLYCYGPATLRTTRDAYGSTVVPKKSAAERARKDAEKLKGDGRQVQLCFIGDPYCKADETFRTTRDVLGVLLDARIPVAILTKGGDRCLRDIDLFGRFGESIKIGMTLTFDNDADSREWEQGAALPDNRIATLDFLHACGLKTWASFEPVVRPLQSVNMLNRALPHLDEIKIGKLNNYQGMDVKINWTKYLAGVLPVLRESGKPFYVKEDLVIAAGLSVHPNETEMDRTITRPFDVEQPNEDRKEAEGV